jgi:hypothetical protein
VVYALTKDDYSVIAGKRRESKFRVLHVSTIDVESIVDDEGAYRKAEGGTIEYYWRF